MYVTTGFSLPYVAEYTNENGTNTFAKGQKLARGVSVAVDATVVDDNNFYADNIIAETENGVVSGGTLTLTVDGLSPEARRLIYGLPTATDGWTAYGDGANIPYMAVGFIRRTMNEGVTNYWAVVFPKCRFAFDGEDASTQEDEISWQTKELEATFMRDDTSAHNWKYVNDTPFATEKLAEDALKAFLSI